MAEKIHLAPQDILWAQSVFSEYTVESANNTQNLRSKATGLAETFSRELRFNHVQDTLLPPSGRAEQKRTLRLGSDCTLKVREDLARQLLVCTIREYYAERPASDIAEIALPLSDTTNAHDLQGWRQTADGRMSALPFSNDPSCCDSAAMHVYGTLLDEFEADFYTALFHETTAA